MKLMNINVGQFISLLDDGDEVTIVYENNSAVTRLVKYMRNDKTLLKKNITRISLIFDDFNYPIYRIWTYGVSRSKRRLIGKDIANVLSDDIDIYYRKSSKSHTITSDRESELRYIDNIKADGCEQLGAYILIEPSM